ncbi:molybdenum cofactor guanylyltransferase MobA [Nitratifractor salsuginis]|uniref:Probable molybdenum cofactor guanylyltransferase n=1 Tax=Nitratifractor salsuginis (strain DSM 16511 / JCM 12458 / E9I37-1) TaxID=749222 RepID=E6WXW9_NITSE|nr:molybdenum cofactor guanylyltransferase MobA [Nitratifractor salsuginis]ADV45290.1 molybdopterin-guanine dinucleotide biosynthesis protein A [Nitratifractor salsuginis DSM 16511]
MPLPDDAVILAGGRSSRMGEDKALLPFGECSTLAEYQYRRLQALFPRVWLSSKEDKFPFQAPIIEDRGSVHSPLVALRSLLSRIPAEAAFILGVDLPFVDERVIETLKAQYNRHPKAEAVIPRSPRGVEPLCGIYTTALLPRIEAHLAAQNHKLQELLASEGVIEVPFESEEPFLNLNRPEDYKRALALMEDENE